MIFTTRAEYGVRLLVQIGRRSADGTPVSLREVAAAEGLPPAYLERIVALLKRAGLVASTRGAHGGYVLTRPADQITMDDVVIALDGPIAPMHCFTENPEDGRVACSHPADDRLCATKLLWTRVQGGVLGALARTTLAELVEFGAPTPRPTEEALTP